MKENDCRTFHIQMTRTCIGSNETSEHIGNHNETMEFLNYLIDEDFISVAVKINQIKEESCL